MANSQSYSVKQLRFYSNNFEKNEPSALWTYIMQGNGNTNILNASFESGDSAYNYNFAPAVKIGIQTLPGTKIYLNDNSDYIVIDHTGIYELDVRNMATIINTLRIDPDSLSIINNMPTASLIIDIMYKQTAGEVEST